MPAHWQACPARRAACQCRDDGNLSLSRVSGLGAWTRSGVRGFRLAGRRLQLEFKLESEFTPSPSRSPSPPRAGLQIKSRSRTPSRRAATRTQAGDTTLRLRVGGTTLRLGFKLERAQALRPGLDPTRSHDSRAVALEQCAWLILTSVAALWLASHHRQSGDLQDPGLLRCRGRIPPPGKVPSLAVPK